MNSLLRRIHRSFFPLIEGPYSERIAMSRFIADTWFAVIAVLADVATAFCSIYLAVYIRFRTGWFEIPFGVPESPYDGYWKLASIAALLTYGILRSLRLYRRPQRGSFHGHIPRLVRGVMLVTFGLLIILSVWRNYTNLSSGVVVIYFFVFSVTLLLERGILFRLEIIASRKALPENCVLMIGTDATAARLARCFAKDSRLRVRVSGFLRSTPNEKPDESISPDSILGDAKDFSKIRENTPNVVQVIVTNTPDDSQLLYQIATECEQHFIRFNAVPTLFHILTANVEVETIDDIPLLGLRISPLDKLGNRIVKRIEDICGALIGLLVSAPILLVLAILIRRESPGPIFYGQVRTGYGNKPFTIWKLRSMRQNAESGSGAVFAAENDPRRTKIGAFMREHNLDELPQFWNVLKGDMSLVGPRPERPEFVCQFSADINHYMRRHNCLPGITGWAQVHGLRGNTSISDRLHADLWYMENWSLSLDFKILLRTLFAVKNAY